MSYANFGAGEPSATPTTSLLEVRGGLSHVSPPARSALEWTLSKLALDVPTEHGYFTFDVKPTIGTGGLDALRKLVGDGYVAMVETAESPGLPKYRFTRNPLVVEESAGPGGTFAIVDAPGYIVTTAEYGVKIPGPTWVFPAVVVGGLAALVWLIRRE